MEERKNSAARIKSNNKWTNAHYDRINIAVPKGQKDVIQSHAAARGESVNGFIGRAITETMERDSGAESPSDGVSLSGSVSVPGTPENASQAAQNAEQGA